MTENEELLKLVGFKIDGYVYWSPEGKHTPLKDLPDLFHDLNALDKWVVPVLRERGSEVISFFYNLKNIDCDLCPCGASYATIEGHGETMAAALASAALKFLRGVE